VVFGVGSADLQRGKSWVAENAVFQGFFAKRGAKTWCFDGQFVVLCVVSVVLLTAGFGS
jgi:hypothetical protein